MGYTLAEEDRKGRFDPDLARSLGIPEGPLWGKIHKGESVTLDDGRVIESSTLVGPRRSGRTLVITGDTRPSDTTIEASRGADLLIHEATFADEEAVRASETGHSTAREAAKVAAAAGVRRLALTHFSARYSRDPGELLREAREVFGEVVLARDGMEIEIPFPDERIGSDADAGGVSAVPTPPAPRKIRLVRPGADRHRAAKEQRDLRIGELAQHGARVGGRCHVPRARPRDVHPVVTIAPRASAIGMLEHDHRVRRAR